MSGIKIEVFTLHLLKGILGTTNAKCRTPSGPSRWLTHVGVLGVYVMSVMCRCRVEGVAMMYDRQSVIEYSFTSRPPPVYCH